MYQHILKIIIAITLSAVLGCASIVSGSTQEVNINAKPDAAIIRIYDNNNNDKLVYESKSFARVELNRGSGFFKGASYRVEVTGEGYEPFIFPIKTQINWWYLGGNFFFLPISLGYLIDPATGAMWDLSPERIHANLYSSSKASYDGNSLNIILKKSISDEDFENMEPNLIRSGE